MNCRDLDRFLIDHLSGTLDATTAARVREHLAECASCRTEASELGDLWLTLGLIRDEEPGSGLRESFYGVLSEEIGRERDRERGTAGDGPLHRLLAWWTEARPMRPAFGAALTAAGLVAGVLLGSGLGRPGDPRPSARADGPPAEVAELRDEVDSLSRMVALSLLERESASERLRAVSFSRRTAASDDVLVQALVDTVRSDPSVNVRLAAVDALSELAAARRPVSDALLATLPSQSSPLVQLKLARTVTRGRNEVEAQQILETLLASETLDAEARKILAQSVGWTEG